MLKPLSITICLAVAAPAVAEEGHPLRHDAEVWTGLFDIAVADRIRKKCDTIGARIFRAIGKMRALERRARSLGFSSDEIEAFVEDKTEQDALRAEVYAYLDENGVDRAAGTGYCPLGVREIKQKTPIGALLRQK